MSLLSHDVRRLTLSRQFEQVHLTAMHVCVISAYASRPSLKGLHLWPAVFMHAGSLG